MQTPIEAALRVFRIDRLRDMHDDRSVLTDPVNSVGALFLDRRVPPAGKMDDMVGRRQGEPKTGGPGSENDGIEACVALLKRLDTLLSLTQTKDNDVRASTAKKPTESAIGTPGFLNKVNIGIRTSYPTLVKISQLVMANSFRSGGDVNAAAFAGVSVEDVLEGELALLLPQIVAIGRG
jgi:hypothetical protein